MKRNMICIFMLVLVLFISLVSCAGHQGHGFRGEKAHELISFKLEKELKLTDTQVEAVEQVLADVKAKAAEIHTGEEMEARHEELKAMLVADYLYPRDILNFIGANTEQHEQIKRFAATKIAELHGLLTPDQREKLVELLEKFMETAHTQGGFFH